LCKHTLLIAYNKRWPALLLFTLLVLPGSSSAFDLLEMTPNFETRLVRTTDSLSVTFDESLTPATVTGETFFIIDNVTGETVWGVLSLATVNFEDDTVVFAPDERWGWGRRYRLTITAEVQSAGGEPFLGALPDEGLFVANIPNDFSWPNIDPMNPPAFTSLYNLVTPFLGFNPFAPEEAAEPWEIPGMNVTEAWKYSTGNPRVLIAVIDTGIIHYTETDFRKNIFINAGELPLPNIEGVVCADYDCNGDGRLDVDDYASDDRLGAPGTRNALQLIEAFSDGTDGDGNGFIDDIAGWDFVRGVNQALGSSALPLGDHGHWQVMVAASQGNNGYGWQVGGCPNCLVMPIRASSGLLYDFGNLAAAIRYAREMGASVISHAGANFTWSRLGQQEAVDAYNAGVVTIGVTNDEMSYHHWMPYSGEGALAVKAIFPLPSVQYPDGTLTADYAFTETYCTGYGSHTALAIPSGSNCTSEAVASSSGLFALLFSYAADLGLDLEADEAKQIMTMSAYDIQDRCYSIINLDQDCQPGFDARYGYGRPDMARALRRLGDPDLGLEPTIPPVVLLTSPEWWTTFDPQTSPALEVEGRIAARVYPLTWLVQIAPGHEPLEEDFLDVAGGETAEAIEGLLATVSLADYFTEEWVTRPVEGPFTFDVTLRVQAAYLASDGEEVLGEARKTISIHTDNSPENGLVPGFPLWIGASGESSPLLYDLDGDVDRRPEILFGTGAGEIVVLKHDAATGAWLPYPGFPLDLTGDGAHYRDGIFASLAVGDLFGDGTPEIVAATLGGKVYALDPAAAATGDPLLPGFPVSADPTDSSTVLTFGQGNGFMSSPVLADLDRDGVLEIIAGSLDQKVYAWKPAPAPDAVAPLSGWPVLCSSREGLVDPEKICTGPDIPYTIFGTPAVGILDPSHHDEHIREYPAVLIPTSEECPESDDTAAGRLYAIYHDGLDRPDGPFLPDWPAAPRHASSILPYFNAIGGVSGSPAVQVGDDETLIGVGATLWLPQVLRYRDNRVYLEEVTRALSISTAGAPTMSALTEGEDPVFIMPTVGPLEWTPDGFKLLRTIVAAYTLDQTHRRVFQARLGDLPLLVHSVTADLDNDGEREIVTGSSDFLVHAQKNRGQEVEGWPKYTQKWTLAAPVIGDLDADGLVEVVVQTREGYLYAWESLGETCPDGLPNSDWRRFHHDERNTGFRNADTLPPGRVVDLTATLMDSGAVHLRFTAPGDDWWCGTPASYDIRWSTDENADLTDRSLFEAAAGTVIRTNLEAGGESSTIVLPECPARVVALRADDEAGNVSRIAIPALVASEPADDDDDDDNDNDNDDDNDDNDDNDAAPTDDDAADDDVADDDDNNDNNDGCGC